MEKETKNKETQAESDGASRRESKQTQELRMAKDEAADRRQRLGAGVRGSDYGTPAL